MYVWEGSGLYRSRAEDAEEGVGVGGLMGEKQSGRTANPAGPRIRLAVMWCCKR